MRQQTSNVVQGNIEGQRTADYFMSEGAEVHIMRMLRNMYNDPLKAVLREYLANALDAHREIKSTSPIEISLPGELNNNLSFRDYGPSLTEDEFCKYIVGYGETGTFKFISEDQIGGFGIGCKSFFAISSTAVYILYKDGTKTTWLCQPDETDRGTAKKISQEPTEEADGVQVDIPVDTVDYPSSRIHTKLLELVRYLDYPLVIDGSLYDTPKEHLAADKLMSLDLFEGGTVDIYSIEQNHYHYNYNMETYWNDPVIQINGIPYPLPAVFYKDSVCKGDSTGEDEDFIAKLLTKNQLVINVPDNFLELAPNREGFVENYKTAEGCVKIHTLLIDNLQEYIVKTLKSCEDKQSSLNKALELYKGGLYNGFSGDMKKDMFVKIPYKYGEFNLAEDRLVKAEDIESLGENTYIAGFSENRNYRKSPWLKKSKIVSVEKLFETTAIHSIIGANGNTKDCLACLEENNLLLSGRRELEKSFFSERVYEDGWGLLFPHSVNLYRIPKDKNPRYWGARFIKLHEDVYPGKTVHGVCFNSTLVPGKSVEFNEVPAIIVHGSEEDVKAALEVFGEHVNYQGDLVEIVKNTKPKSTGGATSRRVSKTKDNKWFKFKEPNVLSYKKSIDWEACEEPQGKFLYEVINKFEVPYGNSLLKNRIRFLRTVLKGRVPCLDAVYAVKEKNKNKVPSNGVKLSDYFSEKLAEWHSIDKFNRFTINYFQYKFILDIENQYMRRWDRSYTYIPIFLETLRQGFPGKLNTLFTYDKHPLRRLNDIYNDKLDLPKEIKRGLYKDYGVVNLFMLSEYQLQAPPAIKDQVEQEYKEWRKEYDKMLDIICKRYPYFTTILGNTVSSISPESNSVTSEQASNILKYIRAMDREENRKFSN